MDRTFYLGPIRSRARREYVWNRSRPTDVGIDGERTIEAILAATERKESRNLAPKTRRRPFQEMIAYWLQQMGLVHSFAVNEIAEGSGLYQAKVKVTKESPEVLLTEVGTGVAQVLPVLTLLYYVEEDSTVILEQPEIHLHPLAQAALADVIISVAQHRNIQVIVESHSEHLLLRLQRRIAEAEITPDEVKLYLPIRAWERRNWCRWNLICLEQLIIGPNTSLVMPLGKPQEPKRQDSSARTHKIDPARGGYKRPGRGEWPSRDSDASLPREGGLVFANDGRNRLRND